MSYIGSTPTSQLFAPGTDTFSGTGSQTAFTLSRNVGTVNDILVVVNNVDQQPSAYSVSGSTLTLSAAPSAGTNNIYVRYLSNNLQSVIPQQGSVTPASMVGGGIEFGMRNRIINGDMRIDQRNAGASVSNGTGATANYPVDRFVIYGTQASKFTGQQNAGSVTPPAGFTNYLGMTSSSAYSVLTGDAFTCYERIEGLNISDLGWGTANASTVTLSFWVRSSLTGTFGGALRNSGASRSYPFTYTINAANTWEKETIIIAGDTSGTWLTTNGIGIDVVFGLGAGATYSGTAGAWASANYLSATGATSVVGTNGATFYITGVQLEKGVTATSFDYRPYGTELSLCQRYFEKSNSIGTVVPSNAIGGYAFVGSAALAASAQYGWQVYKVPKRTFATINTYSYTSSTASVVSNAAGTDLAASSATPLSQNEVGFWLANNSAGTLTPTLGGFVFQWKADAEL